MKRQDVAVALLLALGLAQMTADLAGLPAIKGLFMATAASPAPKVFTIVGGYEAFSTRFRVEWAAPDGKPHRLDLTSEVNQRFLGPYNRRNTYGAALSFGPATSANPKIVPMMDAVLDFALCGPAPILQELGVAEADIGHPITLVYEPKQNPQRFPLEIRPPCDR